MAWRGVAGVAWRGVACSGVEWSESVSESVSE